MANLIITRQATDDIDEILNYISTDNFVASIRLAERFSEIFKLLATNPGAGRARPELQEGLHSFPEGSYIIFYRKWAEKVAIARVIHGARDIDEIFS